MESENCSGHGKIVCVAKLRMRLESHPRWLHNMNVLNATEPFAEKWVRI